MPIIQRQGSLVPKINAKDFVVDFAGAARTALNTSMAIRNQRLNEMKVKQAIKIDQATIKLKERELDSFDARENRLKQQHQIALAKEKDANEVRDMALENDRNKIAATKFFSSIEGIQWMTELQNGNAETIRDKESDMADSNPHITRMKAEAIKAKKESTTADPDSGDPTTWESVYNKLYNDGYISKERQIELKFQNRRKLEAKALSEALKIPEAEALANVDQKYEIQKRNMRDIFDSNKAIMALQDGNRSIGGKAIEATEAAEKQTVMGRSTKKFGGKFTGDTFLGRSAIGKVARTLDNNFEEATEAFGHFGENNVDRLNTLTPDEKIENKDKFRQVMRLTDMLSRFTTAAFGEEKALTINKIRNTISETFQNEIIDESIPMKYMEFKRAYDTIGSRYSHIDNPEIRKNAESAERKLLNRDYHDWLWSLFGDKKSIEAAKAIEKQQRREGVRAATSISASKRKLQEGGRSIGSPLADPTAGINISPTGIVKEQSSNDNVLGQRIPGIK